MQSIVESEPLDTFQCAICLEHKSVAHDRESLACNHDFCLSCIGKWRKAGSASCPMCRDEAQHVRIYFKAQDSVSEVLLLSALHSEFGGRICEPLGAVIVDPQTKRLEIWSLLIVPQTLLPSLDALFDRFESRRVQGAPPGAQKHCGSIAGGNESTCYLLEHCTTEQSTQNASTSSNRLSSLGGPAKALRASVMNAVFQDPRFSLMQQNNDAKTAKAFFPLFCRMLEFESAEKVSQDADIAQGDDAGDDDDDDEVTLIVSNAHQAIHREGLDNPYAILTRYGDEWIRAASKLPLSEVEHVARATKNLAITSKQSEMQTLGETDDNEARSIILWQRFRNPICACCWRHDQPTQFKCCSRCESTFYCSEQCRKADWPTHRKWCCNPDAKRMRGVLEMALSAPDDVPRPYVGSTPAGTFEFTPEILQEAFDAVD